MERQKLSRRDFLRMSALTAAGAALAGCAKPTQPPATEAVEATKPPEATKAPAPTTAPAEPEEVTLEVRSTTPEYENAERQIWNIFEAENPGVKIEMFSVNEDQWAAHDAKVAGGWLPDIEVVVHKKSVDHDNYMNYIDLSTIGFPWFDHWQWDVRNTWSDMFGLPGPRALDFYQGIIITFMYHKDIVDQTGWDPQTQVKTMDDLYKFLDDLILFAEESPDLDYGWDRGWINGFMYLRYMNLVPVAFADGGRDRQADCWFGRAKFNDSDSPFRHTFEFSKEMLEKGYNSQNWWNREWETDQEASFNAKKSALLLHGPWEWDKCLATDPEAQLLGFPFPSVDGKKTIVHQAAPGLTSGYCLLEDVQEKPHWEEIKKAFFWWFSPEVVKMRAEVEGRAVLYDLDEPPELTGPQWLGVLQYVGTDFWPHTEMDSGPWGEIETLPYRKGGSPGPWDRGGGSYNSTYTDAIQGNITIQEALDIAQTNWEASFEVDADGNLVVPG